MNPVELAKQLIARPSVTPNDCDCQRIVSELLHPAGFSVERLPKGEVENLWAVHGANSPVFCFLGHTDVVSAGCLTDWKHPPFGAVIEDGLLWGRGAADMKGSIAAFVCAALEFVRRLPDHGGTLAVLLTSDEEGLAVDGTQMVLQELLSRGQQIDMCLVGEPTSEEKLGDVVKNGRRGSLSGNLVVHGTQGHVAYPQLAMNPIHQSLACLAELVERKWDDGDEFFPPTSFQISNIHAGVGAGNVIPGKLEAAFNFRFSSAWNPKTLAQSAESVLGSHGLDYSIDWKLYGEPFLTKSGELLEAVGDAIRSETGTVTRASTTGGTSDGRFVASTGAQVVEFGPINRSIHKANEAVYVDELETLCKIYYGILMRLLGRPGASRELNKG